MDVELTAEMVPINPFDFSWSLNPRRTPSTTTPRLPASCARTWKQTRPAEPGFVSGGDPRESCGTMISGRSQSAATGEIGYVRRPEPGIRTCEETLALRQGSCRDSAWLLVQIARHLGLASRFVSGYLVDLGAIDSADLHAWAEVYLPGAGWVGFDPTSGVLRPKGTSRWHALRRPAAPLLSAACTVWATQNSTTR